MSEELKAATIPAGSPVTINLAGPAAAIATKSEEPEALRAAKIARREAKLAEARSDGAEEILKGLGVKKSERARMIEEIKAGRVKLAEAAKEAEAAKDAKDRAELEAEAFRPLREEAEKLRATLKKYADAEFGALPEAFQKTIVEMKLDDPEKRLDLIDIFKRTGAVATPADKGADKAGDKAATRPATTIAATPTDTKAPGGPTMNHYEQWKQLSNAGQHFLAAQYFHVNQIKILEQRPQNRA